MKSDVHLLVLYPTNNLTLASQNGTPTLPSNTASFFEKVGPWRSVVSTVGSSLLKEALTESSKAGMSIHTSSTPESGGLLPKHGALGLGGLALLNVGMYLFLGLAQSLTNSHLFAHGAWGGQLAVELIFVVFVSVLFKVYMDQQPGRWFLIVGPATLVTVVIWTYRLFTLGCQGCAASG
jgi:hypothetical protein